MTLDSLRITKLMRAIRGRLPPLAIFRPPERPSCSRQRFSLRTTLEVQSDPGPPNYRFSPRFRNPEAAEGPKRQRLSNAERRPHLLVSNAHGSFVCLDISASANSTTDWPYRICHTCLDCSLQRGTQNSLALLKPCYLTISPTHRQVGLCITVIQA